jgi:acetamidase/formamidase
MVATQTAIVGSTPSTVRWGRLPSAAAEPVAYLADGGTVRFDTVSHEGILADQGRDPVAFFGAFGVAENDILADAREIAASDLSRDPLRDGPHIVTGPVAVAGASPGDLLRIEMTDLTRRCGYGIVSNRHNRGVLAGEMPATRPDGTPPVVSVFGRVTDARRGELVEGGQTIGFALSEFLGLIGVASPSEEEPVSTPPTAYGGNLDVRHLGRSSVLYLPVGVDGALLFCGDPHFAQGNGEVALTAFEAPLSATVTVRVEHGAEARRIAAAIAHPLAETATSWIAIGIGADLDTAMRAATRHALRLVSELTGLSDALALAYLSAAANFEVSQAVNGVRGVHCVIDKSDLATARGTR